MDSFSAYWEIYQILQYYLSSDDFSPKITFNKNPSGISPECQTEWIEDRPVCRA